MSEKSQVQVIRAKPGIISPINGVKFSPHERGSISDLVDKPVADYFLLIPGYVLADPPKAVVVATPAVPAPVEPPATAEPPPAPIAPTPAPAAPVEPPVAPPVVDAPAAKKAGKNALAKAAGTPTAADPALQTDALASADAPALL